MMMISRLFLFSCLLLSTCTLISAQTPFSCIVKATIEKNGRTVDALYDLTQLHKSADFYKVFGDADTAAGTSKYTYAFNVCDQMIFPNDPLDPLAGNWSNVCAEATHNSKSSAYQVWYENKDDPKTASCKSLGLWDISNKTTGYPLNGDLSKGVSIKYEGGNECHSGLAKGKKRSFWITIFCDAGDDGSSNPQSQVHEDSQSKCEYEVIFRSPAGCPSSCPLVAPDKDSPPKVCASHGVCGNDQQNGPRCFCNSGYNGNDCMTKDSELDSTSCSGVCVGLIFVLILLIVLLIGGSIIYYRVHKLSTMNITFSALTESFATNAGVENRHDDEEDAGDVNLHTKNPIRGTRGGSHAAPSSSDFVVDDLND